MRPARCCEQRRARGFTLIDILVLIVLLGSAGASLGQLFTKLATQSAQSARDRQALALAESLLAEATGMPFTYCDADDARVRSATGAFAGGTGCATQVDAIGPEPGETRYASPRFDHLSDYHGLAMPGPGCAGLCDRQGVRIDTAGSPLQGCTAGLSVQPQALPGIAALDTHGRPQVLRAVATVACGDSRVQLEALRTRHAPNQP